MFNSCFVFALKVRASDKRIACDEEFSDSDDEGEGVRKNRESYKSRKRLRTDDTDKKDGKFCCALSSIGSSKLNSNT